MKTLRESLSLKLILVFFILSIVPISFIGLITYTTGKKIIIEDVQTHLKNVAILKRDAIELWTQHLEHNLLFLSLDSHLQDDASALFHQKKTSQEFQLASKKLTNYFQSIAGLGHISQISLVDDSTGQIVVSSTPSWVGKFRNKAPYFLEGKENIYVSDIFVSLPMQRPTMVVSGPLKDKNGKNLGVLVLHADFDRLSAIMLERSGLSETTETFLVNNSNLLITNTVFAPDGAFNKWIFGEGAVRAIAGESDVDVFIDYRDEVVIGAYLWLPSRKLALIAKQDVSEAFAPIISLRNQVLFFGFVIAILVGVVGITFGHRIVSSIHKITEGAVEIGKGNLDHRIKSSKTDEIGKLADTFDQMSENIQRVTISLDEKEVLLKEVHHRVKNNLQMIQSLLSLQINGLNDQQLIYPLQDSIHRISSIAMVHETLYKSDDLSTIDLNSYFEELTSFLFQSINVSEGSIEFNCHVEQLNFDVDVVIACGLIVNELVTNSLKYAFLEKETGSINLSLKKFDEQNVELKISDNGVGMEDIGMLAEHGTLGIKLVHILAENQLGGSVEVESNMGLTYRVIFPVVEKVES